MSDTDPPSNDAPSDDSWSGPGPLHDQPTLASDTANDAGDFDLQVAAVDIPTEIAGYRIERLIGSGGMGRVYLAVHGPMERTVALKTLSADRMGSEKSISRFYSEVRAAGRLLHPNIVTAFDAGEAEGIHFLAMEFVDGPTLSTVVAESGPLSVSVAVDILQQAATGLLYAHQASIVHRDIKPGNLMRAPNNVVKLVDLGLATVGADVRDQLDSGRLIGTVEYMAPEQLDQADRADARSDIYALGATFYFLLTGSTPYEGPLLEQIRGHREGPVPDLCAVRHDVDVRLDHVLRRMMAKRPQDRYASLAELLEDLEHWRHGDAQRSGVLIVEPSAAEVPTRFSDTTSTASSDVLGIDLGMFYGSAAKANPVGQIEPLFAGGDDKPLLRLAIGSRRDKVFFGAAAMAYRNTHPQRVTHCLPLYIGQAVVERRVAGECCPPEVLLAMMLRHLGENAWTGQSPPRAAAVTIPSCYDQIHRRGMLQACQVAGMKEVRLIDRSVAAAQAVLMDEMTDDPDSLSIEPQNQLVVCIVGNTTEVVLLRRVAGRVQQLAIAGRWHTGVLNWQQKLVDLAAEQCLRKYKVDPRRSLADATALQIACERSLNQLMLQNSTRIRFKAENELRELEISRDAMFAVGHGWLSSFGEMLRQVTTDERLEGQPIHKCITVGQMSKMRPIRRMLRSAVGPQASFVAVERADLARGAAIAVAGELPGRDGIPLPPLACTPHDLGVLVLADRSEKKHVRPIVPQGTALPARTHRRLNPAGHGDDPQTLSVAEATDWEATKWRSLGSHRLPAAASSAGSASSSSAAPVELGFEVDSNGLLAIRIRDPASGQTDRLPTLPQPTLSSAEIRHWQQWINDLGVFHGRVFS
ncbi:protein kinase domain-containing protein [Roseimaritima ulvae]|uniref:Serine/threonine-protein kinase PknB n=1 Tax=Roseimaritima ulvae TaxID=980254 RepID=A0A5B9QN03_9BACT|nr:protein kinase [Roseimaritima ulvae]QEG40378.1 Serine/threonine-protein kinase PknB [Roseimaritima ulvae]